MVARCAWFARVVDWQEGDELSLKGYVESKVTSGWDDDKGELSLELTVGATVQDMREALRTLWLDTDLLKAASTRDIWVFPTVAGVDDFTHSVDKSEKMVRYYFYDGTDRTFSAASTEASGRSIFGEGRISGCIHLRRGEGCVCGYQEGRYSSGGFGRQERKTSGSSLLVPGKDCFFGITRTTSSVLERQVPAGGHSANFGPTGPLSRAATTTRN